MKAHEIERRIGNALSAEGLAYWNGMIAEMRNEAIVLADREGLDAAVEHVEALAVPDDDESLRKIRSFLARNADGDEVPATIYERVDGSLIAFEDADGNLESPIGEATREQGVDRLENSLT